MKLAGGTLSLSLPKTTLAVSGFNTFTLNKGGNGDGTSFVSGSLILTDDIGSEANSAFTTTTVPISATGFTTSSTSAVAVPEPAVFAMLTLSAVIVSRRQRHANESKR